MRNGDYYFQNKYRHTIRMMKYFSFVLLFLVIACVDDKDEPMYNDRLCFTYFEFGDTSQFQLNQYYYTADGSSSFIIDSINDSRCPEGLECFWEGEIILYGKWLSDSHSEHVSLYSVNSYRSIYPEQFPMTIIDATPYPIYNVTTNPEDYCIELLIRNREEEEPKAETFQIGDTTICRLNEVYSTGDSHYSFYLETINDSRCPLGGMCVWPGEVQIKGEWKEDGQTTDFELYTVRENHNVYPEGFNMKILEVIPYPVNFVYINPDYYQIKLLITESTGLN